MDRKILVKSSTKTSDTSHRDTLTRYVNSLRLSFNDYNEQNSSFGNLELDILKKLKRGPFIFTGKI